MLKGAERLKSLGRFLLLLVTSLAWSPICAPGQEIASGAKGDFLPRKTGEALSITPTDMPDVSCSVVEWNAGPPKPTLTILCPPKEVFAPLRVYLKVSWLKEDEVPAIARTIHTRANAPTKLRTKRSAVWVWLGVQEKQDAPVRERWVAFTGVVDVALLSLPRER